MYLNKTLKEHYLKSIDEVKVSDNEFWRMPEVLVPIMEKINKNPLIQTIYSKLGGGLPVQDDYLEIAYYGEIELKLFRETIPYFINRFNGRDNYQDSKCFYDYHPPTVEESGSNGLICVEDAYYHNVHSIRITFSKASVNARKEFWLELAQQLSSVAPD